MTTRVIYAYWLTPSTLSLPTIPAKPFGSTLGHGIIDVGIIFKPAAISAQQKILSLKEIDVRYRSRARCQEPFFRPLLPSIRISELDRIFTARWGDILPDDDAGIDDAEIMVHHFACLKRSSHFSMRWLAARCPWMAPDAAIELVDLAQRFPMRWSAADLGKRLGLRYADRTRLRITTIRAIDVTLRQANKIRKVRKVDAARNARRAAGVVDRETYEQNSLERTKPWKAHGISRRTWFRRRGTSASRAILTVGAGVGPVPSDRSAVPVEPMKGAAENERNEMESTEVSHTRSGDHRCARGAPIARSAGNSAFAPGKTTAPKAAPPLSSAKKEQEPTLLTAFSIPACINDRTGCSRDCQ
jgi:hypothetical protein